MRAPNSSPVLAVVSVALGLVSLTLGFGAVDLVSPWVLHEGTQVTDVGFGTLTGLVIPIGLFTQARSAANHVAGVLQVAIAALAFLAAGLLTGERPLLVAAAVVATTTAVLIALHPERTRFLHRPKPPALPMLLLALAACAPGSQYALHMAFNQRNGVLPSDAHLGLHHWAALSAAALAALLTALLASFRPEGFVIPGYTAAAAVLAWGLACAAYPQNAGALGSTWGWLAVTWATAFAFATLREARAMTTKAGPPRSGHRGTTARSSWRHSGTLAHGRAPYLGAPPRNTVRAKVSRFPRLAEVFGRRRVIIATTGARGSLSPRSPSRT